MSNRANEKNKRFTLRVLDGTALKLIAMVSMIFDHVGDNFFPEALWMRIIGRIALPVFAFSCAQGFIHTHDAVKYLKRMALFALISEIPFDLVTSGKILEGSHQNIMVTFFWAILGLLCFVKVTEKGFRGSKAAGYVILVLFAISSVFLGMDYSMLAVGIIFIYFLLSSRSPIWDNAAAIVYHAALRNIGIYWFGLLGFIPILMYSGKKGRGLKWIFYCFYPAHLLLIWALRALL